MDDREYDIALLEIKLQNDILEQEWRLHKLGIRARDSDATETQETETPEASYPTS